jgi:flavodoxin
MSPRWKRRGLEVGLILLAIAAIQPLVVAFIDARQARENEARLARGPEATTGKARVAVIYFSRSGNTALMAQRIAQLQGAALYRLVAPDYGIGLLGWARALLDARKHQATITPEAIDLQAYESIYLGSPIWLYSPAPPIWKFVEKNRFDGKRVVLFNTFNSEFGLEYIKTFEALVLARGAISFEHRAVRRGRMTGQISTEELLAAVDAQFAQLPFAQLPAALP